MDKLFVRRVSGGGSSQEAGHFSFNYSGSNFNLVQYIRYKIKSIGTKIKELEKNHPKQTNINRHKKNQENTTKKIK